jgi:8-amino-3,8-dideoxy-alpha-D-manno-octulosonate transaminase
MSWEVFDKILDDLKTMKFKGRIGFNRFNEPLMDKRLPDFIRKVRKELPKTHIYINSNGDLMTLELWKKLRNAGLNYINIAVKDEHYNDNLKDIISALGWKERQSFGIHLFNKNKLHNWAGNIKSKYETPLKKICNLPFYQMVIDYKGQAVLCCRDYSREVKLDVMVSSIEAVWEGGTFENYRKHLIKGERAVLNPCRACAP